MSQQQPASSGSSMVEIGMLVCCLSPVAGAVMSAPIVGCTLASLAMIDSFLMLLGVG